ncbi:hypothetical protein [Paraglaciecola hydrolytica]|uniref:Rad50/SbcC-type AAA domain-containing protein n=1 Tax=Paraglaciecola hydrolytica TaxID=1799789 RepID=A0A135ZZH1_9ALTE|nr:hypothetical protein [Paraglaciecola hydrolytica]KXI28385.1 hypothetical protein AX660_18665 [Paraglaciecola hydrolytica]
MKLVSLTVIGRGVTGWGTEELFFAKSITQLYGANGSGKTPLVQTIAFCLGYSCIFRDDIYSHCQCAKLKVFIKSKPYELERKYSSDFEVLVKEPTGTKQTFFKEGDYSRFLFELLGYEFPQLVTNSNSFTHPYLSTILPLFYLDQDIGYGDFYNSPGSNFIKDQFIESVRLSINMPAKNSFDQRKSAIDAKKLVEKADQKVHRFKAIYEDTLKGTDIGSVSVQEIDNQIESLKSKINKIKSSQNLKLDATDSIDKLISSKMSQIRELQQEISFLESKCSSISSIRSEIEVEINTLSLNEEAKRIFMSFSEICSVDGCGLFLGSSESYGKNLLYLKDQIKDLVFNAESSELKIKILKNELQAHFDDIDRLNLARENTEKDEGLSALVEAIHMTLAEIISLEIKKREIENLSEIEEKYLAAERERDIALNRQDSLSSSPNKSSLGLIRFKSNLTQSISTWIKTINTKNVPDDVNLLDEFKATFGGEKLSAFKGSTKLRVVLSYHAALFEEIIKCNKRGIRFLILDTPRQHDISAEDLNQFIKALKILADKEDIQIVFSTTEYKYKKGANDIDWVPKYDDPSFDQTMYLGKTN